MLCSISGKVPQHPVVSRDGHLYEKALAVTYIQETGKDPVSGAEATVEDLLEVKTALNANSNGQSAVPTVPQLNSIPSLLSSLQTEWDALMLETFSLRKELAQTRQELSSALYVNDAAVRVAARLTKERDDARGELAKLVASLGTAVPTSTSEPDESRSMDVDVPSQLAPEFVEKIQSKRQELYTLRKAKSKAPPPAEWATPEKITQFEAKNTAKSSLSSCFAEAVSPDGKFVVVGGSKSQGFIYTLPDLELFGNFSASGIITSASWLEPSSIAVASKSGLIDIVDIDVSAKPKQKNNVAIRQSMTLGKSPLVSVAALPVGNALVAGSKSGIWSIVDYSAEKEVIVSLDAGVEITAVAAHPDGELVAIGTADARILAYKITELSAEPAATFEVGESGAVTSLDFAENGMWLASASSAVPAEAQVWSLRNLSQIATVSFPAVGEVSSVKWDLSAQLLAASGSTGVEVAAYVKASKTFTPAIFATATPAVSVAWGDEAALLVSVTSRGVLHTLE